MTKSSKCAPVGERKRGAVRVAQGHPVTGSAKDGTLMRHPRVYKRFGDDKYRVCFIVGNRRYYGHTGLIDRTAAKDWADRAFARVAEAWRENRFATLYGYVTPGQAFAAMSTGFAIDGQTPDHDS